MNTAVVLCFALAQLTVPQAAQIEFEQAQAQRAVDAKYGNKKPSELTSQETREKIRERTAADVKVLEQHGLEAKEWVRLQLKRDRETAAAVKSAVKALQAGSTAAQFQVEQRSKSEPAVETGLPSDELTDEEAAKAADEALPQEREAKPKKKSSKRHR